MKWRYHNSFWHFWHFTLILFLINYFYSINYATINILIHKYLIPDLKSHWTIFISGKKSLSKWNSWDLLYFSVPCIVENKFHFHVGTRIWLIVLFAVIRFFFKLLWTFFYFFVCLFCKREVGSKPVTSSIVNSLRQKNEWFSRSSLSPIMQEGYRFMSFPLVLPGI